MERRKALIIGIDHYDAFTPLRGCVSDARSVAAVLERHDNKEINFQTPKLLLGEDQYAQVSRRALRSSIEALFDDDPDIALLYFAGHGFIDGAGGYLCSSECQDGSDGVPLVDVVNFARKSKAKNKIIILDSCHGGILGNYQTDTGTAEIDEGMTLLTASSEQQYSYEGGNGAPGVFTNLLVDALEGSAANLVGDITPGSVYAHIDQSLGAWGGQRPVFKTNVKSFVSLRKARPPLSTDDLRLISSIFPDAKKQFPLDPTFEPERSDEQKNDQSIPPPDPKNTKIFKILQAYARVNLVRPVDAEHMWHAAWYSKACELTILGHHYHRLVSKGLI
ncbi:caspase family protein [Agrobacterium tumefaciens]|uniref:caspase family protein n=1 Tax=Agrobacterium tumefaciens TaxID=358 RepID=UPI001572B62A|nr:caspase family protein [Agrobacterium tumefaciens]NTA18962.1 caspase family protein [Agrobacterium tumefaciens]WCK74591.1 caspase family protein [Agrobacterium tumefaciens]